MNRNRHRRREEGSDVETTPEGKRVKRLGNGNTLEDLGDGTTRETYPDGGSIIHNPRALEIQRGIERIDLSQYKFVWVPNCEIFDQFRLLVKNVRITHKRAERLKSKVGRLRGTLAQHENKRSDKPSVAALDYKPAASGLADLQARGQAGKRRYAYEIARSELVAAQHGFADALSALGKFIEENGFGCDEHGNRRAIPVDESSADGALYRLFVHNLGQALFLLQAARKACGKIKDYLDRIPEFEAEVARRFTGILEIDYPQFIHDHPLSHGPNQNPIADLRIARYGSPSPKLNNPILSGP